MAEHAAGVVDDPGAGLAAMPQPPNGCGVTRLRRIVQVGGTTGGRPSPPTALMHVDQAVDRVLGARHVPIERQNRARAHTSAVRDKAAVRGVDRLAEPGHHVAEGVVAMESVAQIAQEFRARPKSAHLFQLGRDVVPITLGKPPSSTKNRAPFSLPSRKSIAQVIVGPMLGDTLRVS